MITKIKLYEETYYINNIEDVITEKDIIDIFYNYGLSCSLKESLYNNIEYYNKELCITCNFSSLSYSGQMPKNIDSILDKIKNELCAVSCDIQDHWIVMYRKTVIFYFTKESIKEYQIKKELKKYNI
jgi:hypothetical protein